MFADNLIVISLFLRNSPFFILSSFCKLINDFVHNILYQIACAYYIISLLAQRVLYKSSNCEDAPKNNRKNTEPRQMAGTSPSLFIPSLDFTDELGFRPPRMAEPITPETTTPLRVKWLTWVTPPRNPQCGTETHFYHCTKYKLDQIGQGKQKFPQLGRVSTPEPREIKKKMKLAFYYWANKAILTTDGIVKCSDYDLFDMIINEGIYEKLQSQFDPKNP